MKYQVIGIAGHAQVGKDTAADYIKGKIPEYQKCSFADPIKAMLKVGLGLSDAQLYGSEKEAVDERYGCSTRHLMQTLGTEWGRSMIDHNIWVQAMIAHLERTGTETIIPDVRFESEAEMIRSQGILIHVRGIPKIGSDHASEQGVLIEHGDIVIKNDASIDEYYLKLEKLVRKHLK